MMRLTRGPPQVVSQEYQSTYVDFFSRSDNLFRGFLCIFSLVAWLHRCFGTASEFRANEIMVKFQAPPQEFGMHTE